MERHSRNLRLVTLLGCALLGLACSKREAKPETEPVAASAPVPSPVLTARPAPRPLAPPVTPTTPPQFLACRRQDFYRIGPSALEVFEIASVLPPPQIRGSRVARKTAEVPIKSATNVVALPDGGVVVIAQAELLRYRLGDKNPARYAPLPGKGEATLVWSPGTRSTSIHTHQLGDKQVLEFAFGPQAAGGTAPAPRGAGRAVQLPEFDARFFTVLSSGELLYSTPSGLVRAASKPVPVPSSQPGPEAKLVFPDPSADFYWVADAAGQLERRSVQDGTLRASVSVPGTVVTTAIEGVRLAVLSLRVVGLTYQATVTLLSAGKQLAKQDLGPVSGSLGLPRLDLCLIEDRPWVVVGDAHELELRDLENPRLLAEW